MASRTLGAIVLACLIAWLSPAAAQSTLLQGGPITPGHAPMYLNSGSSQAVVQDSGPAGGGGVGLGMGEGLYVARGTGTPPYVAQGTGPLGTNWCDYDASITNAAGYHYLCMSANAAGGGLLVYGAGGAASQLPFNIVVNGVILPLPGATNTFVDNLTATGSNQGTAFLVSGATNAFTTVGSGTGGILPTSFNSIPASAGLTIDIINAGAHPLLVYPPAFQSIEGGSPNVPMSIYMNSSARFIYRGLISGIGSWYAR